MYDDYDFSKTAIVIRCKEKWKGKQPSVELMVDDDVIGLIVPGETRTVNVSPGKHTVRIGGVGSKMVMDVDLADGDKAFVECFPTIGLTLAAWARLITVALIVFALVPGQPLTTKVLPGLFVLLLLMLALRFNPPFGLSTYDPEKENFKKL